MPLANDRSCARTWQGYETLAAAACSAKAKGEDARACGSSLPPKGPGSVRRE
jgi:hypothetical protein